MNLYGQSYKLSDTDTQEELLVATLTLMGAKAGVIAKAVTAMRKRVDRFYNGTSKYNGNGELKND